MRSFIAAFLLSVATVANAQFCPSCIQNSAASQNAQFNVSSATIRGPLTVPTIIGVSSFTATTVTANSVFIGSGSLITWLNAGELKAGTVPSLRLSGPYTGVTGLGTVTAGTWNGSIIPGAYGGTGANLGTSLAGAVPYFSGTGVMSSLAPGVAGYLFQSNGTSAPAWTGAPQVMGTNITSIPMANLIVGELPQHISVNDASISTVSAAKIIGNIPGNATNITGNLALSQLQSGTLSTSVAASSITATGVSSGTYGGPWQLVQIQTGFDGRLYKISQSSFTVFPSSIQPGALPSGVTIGASQVTGGVLGNTVIASSVAATSVSAASYGLAAQVGSFTVGGDGRLTAASNIPIAISPTQLNSGTLPAGVAVNVGNIQSGVLPANVQASSVAANGVTPGVYGFNDYIPQITIGGNGLITSATQFFIPSLSTHVALNDADNNWSHSQTSQSSWTINANLYVNGASSATVYYGDAFALYDMRPEGIRTGILGPTVIASSVAASGVGAYKTSGDAVTVPRLNITPDGRIVSVSSVTITGVPAATVPAAGVLPGTLVATVIASSVAASGVGPASSFGSATQVPTYTVGVDGRLTAASNTTISLTNSNLQSGTYTNVLLPAANVNAGTLATGVLEPTGNLTNGPLASSIFPSSAAFSTKDNGYSVPQTYLSGSSVTISTSEFSVGGSTFVIAGGTTAFGTKWQCDTGSGACAIASNAGTHLYPFEYGSWASGKRPAMWLDVAGGGNLFALGNIGSYLGYGAFQNLRVGDGSVGNSSISQPSQHSFINFQNAVTEPFYVNGASNTTASPALAINVNPSGSGDLYYFQKNGVAIAQSDTNGHWSFGDAKAACSTCTFAVHGSVGVSGVVEADGGVKFGDLSTITSANSFIATTSSPTMTGSMTFGNNGFSTTTLGNYTTTTSQFVVGSTFTFAVGNSTAAIWGYADSTSPVAGATFAFQTTDTNLAHVLNVWTSSVPANALVNASVTGRKNAIIRIHADYMGNGSGTQEMTIYFGKTKISGGAQPQTGAWGYSVDCTVRAIDKTHQWANCYYSSQGSLAYGTNGSGPVAPGEDMTTIIPITFGLSTNISPFKMAGVTIDITSE